MFGRKFALFNRILRVVVLAKGAYLKIFGGLPPKCIRAGISKF